MPFTAKYLLNMQNHKNFIGHLYPAEFLKIRWRMGNIYDLEPIDGAFVME